MLCAQQSAMALQEQISFSSSFFKKPAAQESFQNVENFQKGAGPGARLVQNCLAPLPVPTEQPLCFSHFCSPTLKPFCFLQSWGVLRGILQLWKWSTEKLPVIPFCPFTAHREELGVTAIPFSLQDMALSLLFLSWAEISLCSHSSAGTL